jgi:hypothetical protein
LIKRHRAHAAQRRRLINQLQLNKLQNEISNFLQISENEETVLAIALLHNVHSAATTAAVFCANATSAAMVGKRASFKEQKKNFPRLFYQHSRTGKFRSISMTLPLCETRDIRHDACKLENSDIEANTSALFILKTLICTGCFCVKIRNWQLENLMQPDQYT